MPQIDIKLNTSADTSGFSQTSAKLDETRVKANRMQEEWDKLRSNFQRRFSAPDIVKEFAAGAGVGSGFAVIERLFSAIAERYRQSMEFLREIDEFAKRRADTMENIVKARLTDEGLLAYLQEKQKKLLDKSRELSSSKEVTLPSEITPGGVATAGRKILAPATPEDKVEANKLLTQAAELQQDIENIQKRVRDKATEVAKNDADKAAAERKKRVADQVEENRKIDAALKRTNDSLTASSQHYREMADPVLKYRLQIEEIDRLSKTYSAEGTPFLSAEVAAAAVAKLNQEIAKTKFEAAGGFTPAINASRDALAGFDIELNKISNNQELTDSERREQRIALLKQENEEIERQIAALKALAAANPGMDAQSILHELDSLTKARTKNDRDIGNVPETLAQRDKNSVKDLSDPTKHYQSASEGITGGLKQQVAEIGTIGGQLERSVGSAASGVRSAWGTTFADILLKGGSTVQKLKAGWNMMVTSFVQAGAQMAADWAFKHTVMAAISSLFAAKDVGVKAAAESAKTGVAVGGAAARVAVAGTEAASTTATTTAAAGAQASATGIAGVFRSIMELGPIAGPLVFAASIAGMLALVSSLAKFGNGGIIEGGEQIIRVNERGKESVLNAGATAYLGKSGVDFLNSGGRFVASSITQPAYRPPTAEETAQASRGRSAGGSDSSSRVAFIDGRSRNALEQLKRDPRFRTEVVNIIRDNRAYLGISKV